MAFERVRTVTWSGCTQPWVSHVVAATARDIEAEDTGVMTSASDERGVFAAYGRADDNGMWWAAVGSGGAMLRHRLGFEGGSRMHWWRTEEEALANCAERLRELGYRVAKAKKGGAS